MEVTQTFIVTRGCRGMRLPARAPAWLAISPATPGGRTARRVSATWRAACDGQAPKCQVPAIVRSALPMAGRIADLLVLELSGQHMREVL
jgi:hypothetical protein